MVTIAKKVAPKDPEEKEQKNLIKFIDYLFEKEICHVVAFERFENYITELYLNEYNIDKNVIDASIKYEKERQRKLLSSKFLFESEDKITITQKTIDELIDLMRIKIKDNYDSDYDINVFKPKYDLDRY